MHISYRALARATISSLLLALLSSCGGQEQPLPGTQQVSAAAVTGAGAGSAARASFVGLSGELRPAGDPRDFTVAGDAYLTAAGTATPGAQKNLSSMLETSAGLPAIPELAGSARQTSAAYTDTADPGAPLQKSPAVVAGAGQASIPAGELVPSWAYWGLPTWATKSPAAVQITGSMPVKNNGFKSGIYVGIANYATGRWHFFPNVYNLSAPAQITLPAGQNYISPGGSVYILIVTWNGDTALITGIESSGDDANLPPVASLTTADDLGFAPHNALLDASASSDSDLTIVKYEFDLDEGAGFVDNGNQPTLNHTFNTPGPHLVQVRVTDEGGLSSIATQLVLVVDSTSFLPLSWYRARLNAGLGEATMGLADIVGPGLSYPDLYFTNYLDLATKLPVWFDGAYGNPEAFPGYVSTQNGGWDAADTLQRHLLLASAQYMTSNQLSQLDYNPTLDNTQPLAVAISAFVTAAGDTPDQATYQAAVGSMPLPQQQALARVFLAAASALTRRSDAFAGIGLTDPVLLQTLFDESHGDPTGGLICLDTGQYLPLIYDVTGGNYVLAGLPYRDAFFTGAAELSSALDQLIAFNTASAPVWANINLSVDTAAGQILIDGSGNDTHAVSAAGDGHALLIDLSGTDTYDCHAGANASGPNGVSLLLDLGNGNDVYNRIDDPDDIDRTQAPSNDDTSQQGAGRWGIGMLVDFGGNDEYYSVRMSQGSAVFGVGLLADLGNGTDTYEMEALGQGGGFAGIGILNDAGGADNYTCWHKAQGFGGLMGIGVLADHGNGVDSYTAVAMADPAKPEYSGGAQFADRNYSIAQGCGWGSRWGWLSLGSPQRSIVGGGGYGALFDGGGGDNYALGVLGQGCGFFESTGLLLDYAGADTFTAYDYAQGAALAAGLGALFNLQGQDNYVLTTGVGQGGADNLSVAWLLERAANDDYDAATTGLGAAINNAFGYLVEWHGNDSYSAHGPAFENTTLGRAQLGAGGDPAEVCYGLFVDDLGTDTYANEYANMVGAAPGLPGDASAWVRQVDGTYALGRGSGLDR